MDLLDSEKPIQSKNWSSKEIEAINTFGLLTAKPMVYLLNISEEDFLNGNIPGYIFLFLLHSFISTNFNTK